jgi:biopolymer transport protein TolQ
VIERCRMVMSTPQLAWEQALNRHLSWLANIASISPYIGLLGTVLGIMMAFAALSGAKSANMMVVAPGIAEALVTTALGLVVAIPASVAYNQLLGWSNRLVESMHAVIEQFMLMVDDECLGAESETN